MSQEVCLFYKDGFTFTKIKEHSYKIHFTMENKNIILPNIIDFSLIKLIYDLNSDIYETVNLEKLNENEAIITLVMKYFFEDLGLPQRFLYIHMKKRIENNCIWFESTSIRSYRPDNIPIDSEIMPIKNMVNICNICSPHNIDFIFSVFFEEELEIPLFAEKMVGIIIHKIFKRVKQFIENLRI